MFFRLQFYGPNFRCPGLFSPAPVNAELQKRVLEGGEPITCRPADNIEPELGVLTQELRTLAAEKSITLTEGEGEIDDVLTYALFPQIGLKFLENRGNPDAFEPVPDAEGDKVQPAGAAPAAAASAAAGSAAQTAGADVYTVTVNGQSYVVEVEEGGDVSGIARVSSQGSVLAAAPLPVVSADPLPAPLAGNIFNQDLSHHLVA